MATNKRKHGLHVEDFKITSFLLLSVSLLEHTNNVLKLSLSPLEPSSFFNTFPACSTVPLRCVQQNPAGTGVSFHVRSRAAKESVLIF